MHTRNPTSERLTQNFERFNPYAAQALRMDQDSDVYATLALAFELSQLRYQLSKRDVDKDARTRVGSRV